MTALDVLHLIDTALASIKGCTIRDLSCDSDNKSGEIILTTYDKEDGEQVWVISSKDIKQI